MKILITGATGFVGASLCRNFSNKGHKIIATGRVLKPNPNLLKYADYIPVNIDEPIKVFDADVCIHAAGLASENASMQQLNLNNVIATQNVLNASTNCSYFIYISSSSVYDFKNTPAVESESSLNNNISEYGRSKLMAEDVIHNNKNLYLKKLILRPRAIYGVGDRILLPNLNKLVKGNLLFCPVNGTIRTSATNINNISYAIDLFFEQQNKPLIQTYNIADQQEYYLKDLMISILSSIYSKKLPVVNIPLPILKGFATINKSLHLTDQLGEISLKAITGNSILDLTQIKKHLGYEPQYNFKNSIGEISQWIRELGGINNYLKNLKETPWLNQ